jgi:hypothetical protein
LGLLLLPPRATSNPALCLDPPVAEGTSFFCTAALLGVSGGATARRRAVER